MSVARGHHDGEVEPLEQLATETFPSADLVLLCSFGPDLNRTRTLHELQVVLRSAGYVGPLARHLILTSPLLTRRPGNQLVLLRFSN